MQMDKTEVDCCNEAFALLVRVIATGGGLGLGGEHRRVLQRACEISEHPAHGVKLRLFSHRMLSPSGRKIVVPTNVHR